MPKATRAKETSTTPKKRSRKAASENGNEVQLDQPMATVAPELAAETSAPPLHLEEKIRVRAYELFLQRNGRGGSPEQDWFQAVQEIAGQTA